MILTESKESGDRFSPDVLQAMARKAKESTHSGEREAFTLKLRDLGYDPDAILGNNASSGFRRSAPKQASPQPRPRPVAPTFTSTYFDRELRQNGYHLVGTGYTVNGQVFRNMDVYAGRGEHVAVGKGDIWKICGTRINGSGLYDFNMYLYDKERGLVWLWQ